MSDTSVWADNPASPADPEKQLTPRVVKDAWDRGTKSTLWERQTAALNQSFMLNRMWCYWNKGTGRLEELPRNPDRVRASIAKIGPDSNRIMATALSSALIGWTSVSAHAMTSTGRFPLPTKLRMISMQ